MKKKKPYIALKNFPKAKDGHRHELILTARDGGYVSKFTGDYLPPIGRFYCKICKRIEWIYR